MFFFSVRLESDFGSEVFYDLSVFYQRNTRSHTQSSPGAPWNPQHEINPNAVLLKLSGESFCAPDGFGIDTIELGIIANEVLDATKAGAQIAIVVGGGNIIRGAELAKSGDIQQATADYMGMLGTVMNAAALKEKLDSIGVDSSGALSLGHSCDC